jgi:hypothetical protein
VSEQARGASFGLEPIEEFFLGEAGALFGDLQRFYGYRAPDKRIVGPVDHTHRAPADFAGDFIAARLR